MRYIEEFSNGAAPPRERKKRSLLAGGENASKKNEHDQTIGTALACQGELTGAARWCSPGIRGQEQLLILPALRAVEFLIGLSNRTFQLLSGWRAALSYRLALSRGEHLPVSIARGRALFAEVRRVVNEPQR